MKSDDYITKRVARIGGRATQESSTPVQVMTMAPARQSAILKFPTPAECSGHGDGRHPLQPHRRP